MAKSSPFWANFFALMGCRLVAIDKRPGVRPVVKGVTLRHALAKLVTSAAGEQAKMVCGNLQLCSGLEDSIENIIHAKVQRTLESSSHRISKEEVRRTDDEEETESVVTVLGNLNTEMA